MKFWFLRLSLFQKLFIYFMVIIIFSLALVSTTIYIESSRAIENQVSVYLKQIVNNVNLQIDNYLSNYENITLPLVINQEVKRFVENNEVEAYESYMNYVDVKNEMDNVVVERPEIEQIYLMDESLNYILLNERRASFFVEDFYRKLNEMTPESGKVIVYPRMSNNQFVITMARKIRGTTEFHPKGILAVDINAAKLARFWEEIKLEDDSFFMIVDEEGDIIHHRDQGYIGEEISPSLKANLADTSNTEFYDDWNDEKTFFYHNTSDYTGWKLTLAVPESTLFQPVSGIRTTVFISGFIALVIALVFAQHFIRKIVKPIRMIEGTMKNVEKEKWDLAPEPNGNDEIASLVKNYNRMVNRLSFLVDRVYKAELENNKGKIMLQKREIEKRKSELQALQSQINPHFLYNTLGTINSYALLKEIDEISEMTEALASMFRYSVQNLEVATLEKELTHVKDFLIIQEHRWQKTIPIDIEMDEKIMQAKIVKLSLQPLVENAVEHGFQRITNLSILVIKGEVREGILFISVIDNGTGINDVKLNELREQLKNEDLQHKADQGIGLLNVSKRIKRLFGEEYGVEIFSETNKGTTIRMSIPFRSENQE